jgi:mannose-6-phosphate isomerase-like protein (cupin superfamily)
MRRPPRKVEVKIFNLRNNKLLLSRLFMNVFVTKKLSQTYDVLAPDGSEVRILAAGNKGSMAHFSLPPGAVSKAVAHRTVEELWFFTGGRGRIWRKLGDREETVEARPGLSIAIPVGAHFQFRCDGDAPLEAVGVTMPPWPGMEEAYEVDGIWPVNSEKS